ncbi:MAG: MmgE/PrpD family protein [Burkholderiaceae bacterium]|nr:MmgE/PrpD family protein [Burkholderiaceae bacterium]MCD8564778.1 MmgE/PrpD family protein [Burkholderiaceae bacterium]
MNHAFAELRLATHVAQTRYEDLPAHTVERAKTFIADTISVGMAGTAVPEAQHLLQTLKASDSGGPVQVWGTDTRLSAPNAIMANAFDVHCQEYDCVHEGAVVHAMATLLPVLMAQAQTQGNVSGKDLVTAVAVGIDVACTLGLAAKNAMQFFRPATAGGFGAVAGLAKLRELTPDQIVAAWGFQLAQTSGTMQGHREGRPVLPLQVSFNARAAWQSCELAQSGLQSLDLPISGECGYLAMFERDYQLDSLLELLGRVWRIDEFSHKPYPSGRATHAGVEGLLHLMQEHQLEPDSIAAVVVAGPSLISRLVNRPPMPNPSPNYARLCMPFVLAKVMQYGRLEPKHYFGHELTDHVTFKLAQKVSMRVDDNPDPNAFTPASVEVELANGKVIQTNIAHMLASPKRPLTRQQCQDKFVACCALAVNRLGQSNGAVQHLFENWLELENVNDLRDLFT